MPAASSARASNASRTATARRRRAGLGLFLGVELVRDRNSLEPATEEAALRRRTHAGSRHLLSTDGPDDNVLKIRPPLVFGEEDAERFGAPPTTVLAEDFVRSS